MHTFCGAARVDGKMNKALKRMVAVKERTGYLEARRITEEKGGLPSHVMHDDYLLRTGRWREVQKIYPAWAKEIIVYPRTGWQFEKGKDVVDSETGWILPAMHIPKEAIRREKIGLFVDPEEITEENGNVVVHPKSIVVLKGFIQQTSAHGKMDEKTRIPLEPEPGGELPEKDIRLFYRIYGAGIRPLVRGYENYGRGVVAYHGPDRALGVAYVEGFQEKEPLAEGIAKT